MSGKNILSLLRGGDRRMIGLSERAAAMVSCQPNLFPDLIAGLWSADEVVRMRAADACEKITRGHPQFLQPHKRKLLALMAEARQQELRWHLAAMAPRLSLTPKERRAAIASLLSYLQDRSSIVKTFALQGLAELAQKEPAIRGRVLRLLIEASKNGTPAMKVRSRKLLAKFDGV